VDQIRQQRDTEGARVNERLRQRRHRQDREAPRHRTDPRTRAKNRTIDEAMRMVVRVFVLLVVVVMYRVGGLYEQRVQVVMRVLVFAQHRPVSSP
jgi:hypothetical protein